MPASPVAQLPVALLAGPTATVQEIELVRRELGLDQPMAAQFLIYAQKVVSFDLGRAATDNRRAALLRTSQNHLQRTRLAHPLAAQLDAYRRQPQRVGHRQRRAVATERVTDRLRAR